jgi:hypothetical protein
MVVNKETTAMSRRTLLNGEDVRLWKEAVSTSKMAAVVKKGIRPRLEATIAKMGTGEADIDGQTVNLIQSDYDSVAWKAVLDDLVKRNPELKTIVSRLTRKHKEKSTRLDMRLV